MNLSARGTKDPDDDQLKYRWWHYRESGSYEGTIDIPDADQQDVSFIVPVDGDTGDSIHIVCEVTDTGTPALTRYQRVVVEIE